MVVFCAFDQQMELIEEAKKHGLNRYINLVFTKNFSAQVLKANMRVVGNCEYGLILYRDKLPKFNNGGKMVFNAMEWPRDTVSEKIHPTQKPVPLMEWCLSFAPDARTVCDPFMGSGTTGVACARMGLQFVGIERERKYFDIACRRIEQAYAQPRLFEDAKVGAGYTAVQGDMLLPANPDFDDPQPRH